DVQSVLKDAARGLTGDRAKLRQALNVAEVALTLTLLIGAGLLARSLYRLRQVNAGFTPERVLSFRINLPERKNGEKKQKNAFYQRFDEKKRSGEGGGEVAFGNQFPLGGRNWQHTFSIDGQQSPQHPASMELNVASTNYFHVLGIPLLRGRYFTEQDNLEHLNGPEFSGKSDEERANASVNVMIIDEEFAGRYWPNEDPIGKRVSGALVVGVVARVKLERLGEQGGLVQAYIPLLQSPDNGGAV